jgi:hypothetical protein
MSPTAPEIQKTMIYLDTAKRRMPGEQGEVGNIRYWIDRAPIRRFPIAGAAEKLLSDL